MNKDRVKGKAKDVAGRIERQVGEWTGDPKTQAKGAAKQVEGKVQNAAGKLEDAVRKADKKTPPKPPKSISDSPDFDESEDDVRRSS